MNLASPPNVFIVKDKAAVTQNPPQHLAFPTRSQVAASKFPDNQVFLGKSTNFSISGKEAYANKFASPGPDLKAGFRVLCSPTD